MKSLSDKDDSDPSGFFSNARSWMWSAMILSVLVCAGISWLHLHERRILSRVMVSVENIRHARIALAKGFLQFSLARGPEMPFDRDQGLVQLRQGISALEKECADFGLKDKPALETFRNSVGEFQRLLLERRESSAVDPGKDVSLRIAFHDLEQQADRIDAEVGRHVEALSASLDKQLLFTLVVAALFLAGVCCGVWFAMRAKDRSDELMKENSLRLQMAVEAGRVGLWDWDLLTNKVFYSEEWKRQIGYLEHEIRDDFGEWENRVHPGDLPGALEVVHGLIDGAVSETRQEFRLRHKDGSCRWILAQASLRHDKTGKPLRMLGSHIDITERKRAEEALHQSEQKYKRLAENSLDVIYRMSLPDGRYEYVSRAATSVFGYPPEEWYANPLLVRKIIHPDWHPYFEEQWESLLKGYAPPAYEYQTIHPDGSVRWMNQRNILVVDDNGRPAAIEGIVTDITERKRSEQALRLHVAILETVAEGVFLIGVDDNLIKWTNRKFEEMFGYEPGEMIGMHVDRVNAPTDRTPSETRISIVEPLLQAGEWHGEIRSIRKDGSRFWCYIHVSLFDHPQFGKVMVSAHTDITKRKKAEEEKDKIETQLLQAQKLEAVGRLAGGVAHDFNNMLSIILGHAELILDETAPDSPLYHDIMEIQTAAQRSTDLTRQLLAFARKQTISPKVLDLNETASGILKMLRRLIGEDIDLAWVPGPDVWPVKMDPGQLDQILANLAVNARDAIAGVGTMTIETSNAVFDEAYCRTHEGVFPGDYAMIVVTDTGVGMERETLDRIFEPFFTTKELSKGTGLGLATVYGIVKQNNGFINVYSEPGYGTTFKIYIPRAEQPAEERLARAAKKELKGSETVLLVEDEESILALAKSILERHGYVVLATQSPGEALKAVSAYQGPIHLLVTDVVMPEMNGKDLRDKLTEIKPGFRSIFMSGYTANVIAHHGVLDEGIDFLQKPFSVQGFAEKVRDVLDG